MGPHLASCVGHAPSLRGLINILTATEDGDIESDGKEAARRGLRKITTMIDFGRAQESMQGITQLIDDGLIHVPPIDMLPLQEAALAHRMIDISHLRGKLVLKEAELPRLIAWPGHKVQRFSKVSSAWAGADGKTVDDDELLWTAPVETIWPCRTAGASSGPLLPTTFQSTPSEKEPGLEYPVQRFQVITLSKSQVAEFSRKRAQEQARFVDPVTLAHAVCENVEAQIFCLWARLCVYVYGRITPALRSYLDERCPGFAGTVSSEESRDLNDLEFWRMLRKWFDAQVFGHATAEGWNHALGYYTAAHPDYKKADERWLNTKRALESGTLTDMPLYEFWRDAKQ